MSIHDLDEYKCTECGNCHELCFCETNSLPKPGSNEWESMIDFMRADLKNSGMQYTKIIKLAKEKIEAEGRNFEEEFAQWKKEKRNNTIYYES